MADQVDYKAELLKLIQVQEMDAVIYDLSVRSESFPLRIQEIDLALEQKKSALTGAEDELKKLQVAKNQKEADMQSKEELIKKHQVQLYQIKNNKEYSALQQEIESVKADISLIEEEIINFFDKIDAAKSSCENEKKLLEEEKRKAESDKAAIKAEEKKVNDELAEALSKRDECAKAIDKSLLSQYDRIRKSRGRLALAKLDGETCGACNMTLRPQIINEARLKKGIVLCENCSRMLYSED